MQKQLFRVQLLRTPGNRTLSLKIPLNNLYKNVNGLEWHEHGKELVIAGQFHEVLAVKWDASFATITLIKDDAENELFKRYFEIHHSAKNSNWQTFLSHLGFQIIDQDEPLSIKCTFVKSITYQNTENSLVSGCESQPFQPPKG